MNARPALLVAARCGSLSCNDDGTTGSIRGRICDLSGDDCIVGGSVVVAWDSNGDSRDDGSATDTTDSDGWSQLDGVPLEGHPVVVQEGSFTTRTAVVLSEPGLLDRAAEGCLEQAGVKIGLATRGRDDIGSIHAGRELAYDRCTGRAVVGGSLERLRDPSATPESDTLFVNCGSATDSVPFREDVGGITKEFVENGGSIGAPACADVCFAEAVPAAIDFLGEGNAGLTGTPSTPGVGAEGRTDARIVGANLMAAVGSNLAELTCDLGGWIVPLSRLSRVTPRVRGDARTHSGGTVSGAPLAVKLEHNGVATFTTFPNERQITIDMEKLPEEIILNL